MECLVRLETFLNITVFLFISYWIVQKGISICRLKIVLNSVKKTAAIATKSKLISLLDEVSISLFKLSQIIGSAITYILLDFGSSEQWDCKWDPTTGKSFHLTLNVSEILPKWKAPQESMIETTFFACYFL